MMLLISVDTQASRVMQIDACVCERTKKWPTRRIYADQ